MFRLHKLTPARSRNSCGAGAAMASAFGIFPHIYQGLERAEALVNLSARRFRRRSFRRRNADESVRDKLTNRCRHSQDAYKKPIAWRAAPRRSAHRTAELAGRSTIGRTIMSAHPFQWSAQSSVKIRRDVGSSIRSSPPAVRSQACCLRRANRAEPCRSPRSWTAGRT